LNNRKLILFDYDGVIVDSMNFNLKVVSSVLENMGFSDFPTVEFCREAECISFEAWARKIGVDESLMDEYVSGVHDRVIAGAPSLPLFNGMDKLLLSLCLENDLGVITANSSEAARNFLSHHGIAECFSYIVGCDTRGPKSEKISKIIEESGCSLENAFFIGDAGTDVQQGRLAGVKTIAVTWGFQGRSRLEIERPDFIVDSIEDLNQILCS